MTVFKSFNRKHIWRKTGVLLLVLVMLVGMMSNVLSAAAESGVKSALTEGKQLIADFSFDDEETGFSGAGAVANFNGTAAFGEGSDGTQAAKLSSGFWLDVTKEDGSPLLAGLKEITVSYDSAPEASSNSGWTFFATRTYRSPKYQWESYLGVLDKPTNITVERYHNSGSRPESSLFAIPAEGWRHVDIEFTETVTKLYINGVLKNIQPTEYALDQVLSENGGILHIGHATWGGNEYYNGLIDNFQIWAPAELDEAGKVAAAKEALDLPYGIDENEVYGNITLPSEGLYGTAITWETDSPAIVDVNGYENSDYDPTLPGQVTRPDDADAVVKMTATITSGGASDTKEFSFTVKQAPAPLDDMEAYLFAHFTGTEGSQTDEQIYFATSLDGTKWEDTREAGNPVLTSTSGDQGVRDPYIIRSHEGDKFYLIATDLSINRRGGWGNASWQCSSTKLVVWESTDLVNWGSERLIDVAGAIPDAGNLWAPEAIYDEKTGDYFVFWATVSSVSNELGDQQNMYYSRTRDFYTFTEPKLWIDETNSIIDTTIIKVDDTYYRASGNGAISIDSTNSLTGEWDRLGTLQNIFSGSWSYGAVEGPEFFLYNQKDWTDESIPTWGLIVDQYGTGRGYKPFRTTDISDMSQNSWSVGNDIDFDSLKKRHGSIMSVTKDEYDAVMEAFASSQGGSDNVYDEVFELPEGMNLLVDCDFETLNSSTTEIAAGDYATVAVKGTASTSTDTPDGSSYAASLSSNFWMDIKKNDGTPLLAGLEEIVVSYDSKPSNSGNGWTFYADRDTSQNVYPNEHYLGVMDKQTSVEVQRFNNAGSRPSNSLNGSASAGWKHVDLVVREGSTALYINGQLADNSASDYKLSDILTAAGGVVQFGKANWLAGGEYYNGLIDNLQIYAAPAKVSQLLLDVKSDYAISYKNIDGDAKEATLYISKSNSGTDDLTNVPLELVLLSGASADHQEAYDLTSPVEVIINHESGITETWTIKAVLSNNPVLAGRYADPDVLLASDGKYYIYPTTDGYPGWGGYQFKVFSSEDLIDWTDEGVILDLKAEESYLNEKGVEVATVPWSTGNAWAPAIEEKDGKFYYYFCGHYSNLNNKAIGVAVSDSPTGPFTVKETPIISMADCQSEGINMGQVIDPQIYTEDGASYMLFGNGNAAIVQLSDDMMSIVPGTMENYAGATGFREAIAVNKIDGMYHFTWSCDDTGNANYSVRYGISDSLYGPILDKGYILQKDTSKDILGTGHHAILHHEERDEYYIVYHRFWTPLGQDLQGGGLGNNRETCIDKLEYKNGVFQVVKPTHEGITEPVYAIENKTMFSLDELEADANLDATTYITDRSGDIEAGSAIMAVYDSEGVLLNTDVAEFVVDENGRAVISNSVTLPSDVTGVTVKVFVWDEGFVPIRAAAELK